MGEIRWFLFILLVFLISVLCHCIRFTLTIWASKRRRTRCRKEEATEHRALYFPWRRHTLHWVCTNATLVKQVMISKMPNWPKSNLIHKTIGVNHAKSQGEGIQNHWQPFQEEWRREFSLLQALTDCIAAIGYYPCNLQLVFSFMFSFVNSVTLRSHKH